MIFLEIFSNARERYRSNCLCVCICLIFDIGLIAFLFPICVILFTIACEIAVYLYIAYYFVHTYTSRASDRDDGKNLQSWKKLISFIYSNKGYDISELIQRIQIEKDKQDIDRSMLISPKLKRTKKNKDKNTNNNNKNNKNSIDNNNETGNIDDLEFDEEEEDGNDNDIYAASTNMNNYNIGINNEKLYQTPYSCTAKQDRIIRICCINYAYLLSKGVFRTKIYYGSDKKLLRYLHGEQKRSFMDVKELDDIASNSSMETHQTGSYLFHAGDNDNNNKKQSDKTVVNYGFEMDGYVDDKTKDDDNNNNNNKSKKKDKDKNKDKDKGKDKMKPGSIKSRLLSLLSICLVFWQVINEKIEGLEKEIKVHGPVNHGHSIKFEKWRCKVYRLFIGLNTFVFGPIYLISRLFQLFFPVFIIFYAIFEIEHGINEIDMLQWIMLCIYLIFVCIVCILTGFMTYYSYYESYILPASKKLPGLNPHEDLFVKFVIDYFYPQLIIAPIRDYLVRDVFGKDVGNIVLSYLDDFDFEQIGDFSKFVNYVSKEENIKLEDF